MYTTQPHASPPKPRRRWNKAKGVSKKGKESRKDVACRALFTQSPQRSYGLSIVYMFPKSTHGIMYVSETFLFPHKPPPPVLHLEYSSSLQPRMAPSPPFPALSPGILSIGRIWHWDPSPLGQVTKAAKSPQSQGRHSPRKQPRWDSSPSCVLAPLMSSCPSGLLRRAAPWGLLFSVWLWVTLHPGSSFSHSAFVLIYRSLLSFFWALSC